MTSDRLFYSFEEQYGRPEILILCGRDAVGGLAAIVDSFRPKLEAIAARDAEVLIVTGDDPLHTRWRDVVPAQIRILDGGTFLSRCGVSPEDMLVLVVDRGMRVAMRGRGEDDGDLAAACLRSLDELPAEAARDVRLPVPLLMLPNLLSRDLCRMLIAYFEGRQSVEGEVARIDASGRVQSVIDHSKKRRRDVLVPAGDELHEVLHQVLISRCAPEIRKVFHIRITHADRLLIARYDENADWFRRHRDDAADNVTFRQFAISINLNAEDHEGGHLLFPEYSDNRYRPETGAGIIFSASILHEATPVTRGRRYALLRACSKIIESTLRLDQALSCCFERQLCRRADALNCRRCLTFVHDDAAEARRRDYFAREASFEC
jgi:predicted 2-oxoglutarate/Fe(II)-dependent dioxygenase YbiX